MAAFAFRPDVIDLLLGHGAKLGPRPLLSMAQCLASEGTDAKHREDGLATLKALVAAGTHDTCANEKSLTATTLLAAMRWLPLLEAVWPAADESARSAGTIHAACSGACDAFDATIVRWLVDHGARVDYRAPNGETALYQAMAGEHFEAAHLLIELGADPHLPPTRQVDRTPWNAAPDPARRDAALAAIERRKLTQALDNRPGLAADKRPRL